MVVCSNFVAAYSTFVCLIAAAAPAAAQLTACQTCCAPGGDCSRAYKGAPGKCCGVSEGQSFCCPGAAGAPGAKCYNCGSTYRCYSGLSSRNICGAHPHHAHPHRRAESAQSTGVMLCLAVGGVLGVLWCARRQGDGGSYADGPMGKPVYGAPVGTPGCYGAPMVHAGYSGSAVAGSAAAGFVGGMLLSEAMDAGHAHGGYSSYGGGDYGGGDFGGGDFGGGDGGFAADS